MHQLKTQVKFLLKFSLDLSSVLNSVWLKKDTKLNQVFCLIKISEIISIFLPGFYLIIWLMTSPKNFEKKNHFENMTAGLLQRY